MKEITVSQLLANNSGNRFTQWVDVRSTSEFAAGHIPGAVNIPMEEIESRMADLISGTDLVLICQAGARARMVAGWMEPCGGELLVLAGGTDAWIEAGCPTVVSRQTRWSLERQVRLAAGFLLLSATLLAFLVDLRWLDLSV